MLRERLGLNDSELQIVRFMAAWTLSVELRRLVIDETPEGMTLDALRSLVFGERAPIEAFEALLPEGALRRYSILERMDRIESHESKQCWALSRRVLRLLHGENELDPALARLCRRDPVKPDIRVHDRTLQALRRTLATGALTLVTGKRSSGKRSAILQYAAEIGLDLLTVDLERLDADANVASVQLRAIARECKLLRLSPLLLYLDSLVGERDDRLRLVADDLLPILTGPVIATAVRAPRASIKQLSFVEVELLPLTFDATAELWLASLRQGTDGDARLLADSYAMAPGLVVRAAEIARARAADQAITHEDVFAGIRAVLDDNLRAYARRLDVTQRWEDLVLPDDQMEAVTDLLARVQGRRRVYEEWGFAAKVGKGLGISALFSGPPGTGKTMACALIARDLALEIYQVDLSKIVSKWVGETEKNLASLFDAAEATRAVLLFDEADSLFGRRTDVKTSNDRSANLETNYLLQRLESYDGICLLTTNFENNIDPAFLRRLSLHVRFPMPDHEVRARLWAAMLTVDAPVSQDIDLHALASRFTMSGGYIRNAVLRAAFHAAAIQSPIDQHMLERAARIECEAMGRLVT